ncbi:MAG: toxin-activating lysine-acyltransferase [Rhodocyclales bacterium]|nr:toxin-activating lysine-acyltransferase [Rhodocyclales bacterium]
MTENVSSAHPPHLAEIRAAAQQLAKLPILGPALWLYARDAAKKYLFLADIDARLMPPLVLDQCRIWFREGIPWAFVTWAKVSDEVNQRLADGIGQIAPHEWNGGPHVWLVDVVSPFEKADALIEELKLKDLAGMAVRRLRA